MKTYKNPAMEIMCFSDEDIVTTSLVPPTNTGLEDWQTININGQVVTKSVNDMSDMLKFTF